MDREDLGRLVRETWVRWAAELPDPDPSWLTAVQAAAERLHETWPHLLHDGLQDEVAAAALESAVQASLDLIYGDDDEEPADA